LVELQHEVQTHRDESDRELRELDASLEKKKAAHEVEAAAADRGKVGACGLMAVCSPHLLHVAQFTSIV
jgi:hypothetical protein